jgi:HK97 family phage major capsid protein
MAQSFQRINEYISTGDGSAGTLLIPKLILPTLMDEQEKALIPRELAAMVISGFEGSSITKDLTTENTLDVRSVAEGAEVPLDAIGFESVTFTPVKYGVSVRITREMMEDSQFDIFRENLKIVGRRFAENETNLILGALNGANTTVAGGASVTVANITEAMLNVEDADYMPTDIIVGNEVVNDLRNIDLFVEFQKSGNTDMLSKGFTGTIYGLNVVRFSSNAGANAVKTSAYVLDRSKAYGIAIKRDISVENVTMPTYDMEGAVITQRIDVKLLRSKAVSKITSA